MYDNRVGISRIREIVRTLIFTWEFRYSTAVAISSYDVGGDPLLPLPSKTLVLFPNLTSFYMLPHRLLFLQVAKLSQLPLHYQRYSSTIFRELSGNVDIFRIRFWHEQLLLLCMTLTYVSTICSHIVALQCSPFAPFGSDFLKLIYSFLLFRKPSFEMSLVQIFFHVRQVLRHPGLLSIVS